MKDVYPPDDFQDDAKYRPPEDAKYRPADEGKYRPLPTKAAFHVSDQSRARARAHSALKIARAELVGTFDILGFFQ